MRMTFNRSSQLALVSGVSLLAAALITACGTLTEDFVYVSSAKAAGPNSYGEIDVYEINSQSGRMRQIPTSPFPSGGRNPVAEATSPDNLDLYVVNEDDNTIVQFIIGSDGKLYPQNTVNTQGVFPVAVATAGSYLYVADTYQPLPTCSTAAPCSGSIAVYPILTAAQAGALTPPQPPDTLGTAIVNTNISASYWPLTLPSAPTHVLTPTAITTGASGAYVYATAYDTSVTPSVGYIFGFTVNGDGTLSPLAGSPLQTGSHPSGIASGPGGSNVYVTDYANGNVHAYAATNGVLAEVGSSPFPAGNEPAAVVVDASGAYVFVVNSLDSTVTVYSTANGVLTSMGNYTTGTQPVAIGIDPSSNEYLYTANFLGNNVSGFQLNSTTGALLNSQYSPSPANANPTAVAAIPHGTPKK
jgi:6-phosphogluconolactonase (cycloisomerase 2 family)